MDLQDRPSPPVRTTKDGSKEAADDFAADLRSHRAGRALGDAFPDIVGSSRAGGLSLRFGERRFGGFQGVLAPRREHLLGGFGVDPPRVIAPRRVGVSGSAARVVGHAWAL